MMERPIGEGWKEVAFRGGPMDGDRTFYRGARRPTSPVRFLDPVHDPANGVNPGDLLHIYDFHSSPGKPESYQYRGPERSA